MCVGQNIALVEIHKFISQFVHHFNLELVNTERPWVTQSQWFPFSRNSGSKWQLGTMRIQGSSFAGVNVLLEQDLVIAGEPFEFIKRRT